MAYLISEKKDIRSLSDSAWNVTALACFVRVIQQYQIAPKKRFADSANSATETELIIPVSWVSDDKLEQRFEEHYSGSHSAADDESLESMQFVSSHDNSQDYSNGTNNNLERVNEMQDSYMVLYNGNAQVKIQQVNSLYTSFINKDRKEGTDHYPGNTMQKRTKSKWIVAAMVVAAVLLAGLIAAFVYVQAVSNPHVLPVSPVPSTVSPVSSPSPVSPVPSPLPTVPSLFLHHSNLHQLSTHLLRTFPLSTHQ